MTFQGPPLHQLSVKLLLRCTQERKGRQIAHKIHPGLSLATVLAGWCPLDTQVIKGTSRFAGQWCTGESLYCQSSNAGADPHIHAKIFTSRFTLLQTTKRF